MEQHKPIHPELAGEALSKARQSQWIFIDPADAFEIAKAVDSAMGQRRCVVVNEDRMMLFARQLFGEDYGLQHLRNSFGRLAYALRDLGILLVQPDGRARNFGMVRDEFFAEAPTI